MQFEVVFDTNVGRITAKWDGGTTALLYHDNTDRPVTTLDMWNSEADEVVVAKSAKAFAIYVREWLWEMDRGIEFDRSVLSTIDELPEVDGFRMEDA